ncbi:SagB/ThcOx family dehydrogenase [Shimazuella kribbensis]|uniref:SagB/ThcOx family dehydrogenase n=1 Tax=Shimazuella kribbensis TaxID=139808 RepID=UPI00041CDFE8|nr:SagB family peptide dehydrogenase [Shimazuella kribbensis]
MHLHTFLSHLQHHPETIRPSDWEVNWNDAPLPFKQYILPKIALSMEIPLDLKRESSHIPTIDEIGYFLWYIYGLTKIIHTSYPIKEEQYTLRRFVPSGGALYPNELYLYLKTKDIPNGIYHYDVSHHALVLLREGNFDSFLAEALGYQCDISPCFATVFVSVFFWKNFFKYHNFSYRLQGLDSGVLLGQLLEVAKQIPYQATIYDQFLDEAINHLLGLSTNQESTYAVIPLSLTPQKTHHLSIKQEHITSHELCVSLPKIKHPYQMNSKKILPYPEVEKIHLSSIQTTTENFCDSKSICSPILHRNKCITLPPNQTSSLSFYTICQNRTSPGQDFRFGSISQPQLATLLQKTMEHDLHHLEHYFSDLKLAGYLHQVDEVPKGMYTYDVQTHSLHLIQEGNFHVHLQQCLTDAHINLFQTPICLHIIGDPIANQETLGPRSYRMQQMKTGILVQRLLLIASSLGFGGHPLLGYDAKSVDQLYQLDGTKQTSLIQIPIGPFQRYGQYEGSLHA